MVGRNKARNLTQLVTLLSVLGGGSQGLGELGSLMGLLQNGGLAGPSAEDRDIWEGRSRRRRNGGSSNALIQNLIGLLGGLADSSDDDYDDKKAGWLSLLDRAEAHENPTKRMMMEAILELLNERKPDMGRIASRLLLAAADSVETPGTERPEISAPAAPPQEEARVEVPPKPVPTYITRGSIVFPRPEGWPLPATRYIQ